MTRTMRVLAVIMLVWLLTPLWSGPDRLPLYRGIPAMMAERVALDHDDPTRRRVGALYYLGGLRLRSRDEAFGGFSALAVQGDHFTLLSDGGLFTRFRMGADFVPRDHAFGVLPDGPGTGWRKRDRDSEAMTIDPATGVAWIGFERANAIWRYDGRLARAQAAARPRDMRSWPDNGGAEAMVRLRDGRFLVFAETGRRSGSGTVVLRFDRDPTDPGAVVDRFTYRPPDGYQPTDAAELPDGRLIVLNRALTLRGGFTAKLSLVDARAAVTDTRLKAPVIATFADPVIHDNFEGVAVTREGAATIVWLVSDDNGPTIFQRTLLLKFRLELP